MPRFTVWLSEEDHKALLTEIQQETFPDKLLDIASDLIDQVAGIPEDTDDEADM